MTIDDIDKELMPQHIAIIMDGNRRWAKEKGLDTKLGHKAGAETLEKIASYAIKIFDCLCIFNRKLEEN